jgi:DnaJ-class molecular chaperone
VPPGTFHREIIKYPNMGDEREEGAPGDLLITIL